MKIKSLFKDALIISAVLLFLLFAFEGLSSFFNFFSELKNTQISAERVHTEFDPLLGWINKPDIYIKDMYGPNKYLKTNTQSFRNNDNFNISVPDGKRRWICSGDSFTLGYGVDNDNSWCALLGSILPDTETVNMGQGGYGMDQAYLWYKRDGRKLEHDVLVFAFITYDIQRMSSSRYSNYPKPLLSVIDGEIVLQNDPLPRPDLLLRHIPRYAAALSELNMVRMMRGIFFSDSDKSKPSKSELSSEEITELTLAIISSLYEMAEKSDRKVLLLHLPTIQDYKGTPNTASIRKFLRHNAKKKGWSYIDLIKDFRRLEPEAVNELFIQQDIPGFKKSKHHYTEKGNQYISELIVKSIAKDPSIAGILKP